MLAQGNEHHVSVDVDASHDLELLPLHASLLGPAAEGLESTKNLLYVLRRASSPCDNWGSYEPAPDSPTGLQPPEVVRGWSAGPRSIACSLAFCFIIRGAAAPRPDSPRKRGEVTRSLR